jgi:class 3 adenylate cyclase
MKMREALAAALRRDPDLLPKVAESLRGRYESDGKMQTVIQAAGALEPILEDVVRKRPSRLRTLGLKSTQILAGLAADDERSNQRLAQIAKGSTVGIVFVDVANFTEMTERVGDDEAIQMLIWLGNLVEAKARAVNGECVKSLGDGYLLAFPSSSQALRGAVAIRDAVRAQRDKPRGHKVRLRISVHAGEPLVEQDDLLGLDVNITARLLDCCKPDQVVVSEAAKDLAERRLRSITFGKRKVVKIRGLSTKMAIYAVEG